MKVIAFSLSHFRPSHKVSKEASRRVASHLLTFRNLGFGEEHVAPDFSEGSWRGYSVLMAFSWRSRPRIASLRSDKFACSLRSSNSPVPQGEKGLPLTTTWLLNVSYVTMSYLTISLSLLIALAASFGVIFFDPLFLTDMKNLLHGMGLGRP